MIYDIELASKNACKPENDTRRAYNGLDLLLYGLRSGNEKPGGLGWGLLQDNLTPVDQYEWNGGLNQQWSIIDVGAEYYKLKARHNNYGRVMDVFGLSLDDGAQVQQFTDNGGCNQKWRLDILPRF